MERNKRLEDIQRKYGLAEATSSEAPPAQASSRAVRTTARRQEIEQEYGLNQKQEKLGQSDENTRRVNDWVTRYNALMHGISDYHAGLNGRYTTDYSGGFGDELDALITDHESIRRYARGSELKDVEKSLRQLQEEIRKGNEYMAQFKSKEEYDSALKMWETEQRRRDMDLNEAQADIDHLGKVLEEYRNLTRWETDDRGKARADLIRQQYGNEEEILRLISEKTQERNLAERLQEKERLSGVTAEQDYGAYSGADASVDNDLYRYINDTNGYRDNYRRLYNMAYESMGQYCTETPFEQKGFHLMTDEEIGIYNYHYAKGGKEQADAYLRSIQETLNYRKATGIYEDLENQTALEMVFGVSAGLDQFKSGVTALISGEDYIPQSAIQMASGMVREDLAYAGGKLPEWLGGASAGQVGYDFITTSANMAPSIVTSVVMDMIAPGSGSYFGATMMGMGAAGNAYQQALNQGYDKNQARNYGLLIGASEAVLGELLGGIGALGGKMSGKVLTSLLNKVDDALLRTAGKLGGKMLSEFSEEYLQEVLTPVFSNLTLMTEEEIQLISPEALYSGFLGALTAGVMEGPSTVAQGITEYRNGANKLNTMETQKQLEPISSEKTEADGLKALAEEMAGVNASQTEQTSPGQEKQTAPKTVAAEKTQPTQSQQETQDSGETIDKTTGEAVTIKEVASSGKGKMILRTTEGRTVDAANIEHGTLDDTLVYDAVARMGVNASAANVLVEAYRAESGVSAEAYAKGIEEAYRYGQFSYPMQEVAKGPFSSMLTEHQRKTAYNLGKLFSEEHTAKKQADAQKYRSAAKERAAAMEQEELPDLSIEAEEVSGSTEGIGSQKVVGNVGFAYQYINPNNSYFTQRSDGKNNWTLYDDGTVGQDNITGNIYELESARNRGWFYLYELVIDGKVVDTNTNDRLPSGYYEVDGFEKRPALKDMGNGSYILAEKGRIVMSKHGQKSAKTDDAVAPKKTAHKTSATKKTTGKVHFDGNRGSLTERQKVSMKALEVLAEVFGLQVYVFESDVDARGKHIGANGWFDPKDNSIHIDIHAGVDGEGVMLYTAAHELGHFIKQWSPEKFKALAEFLMEEYGRKDVRVDALVREQQTKAKRARNYDMSYEEAYEEVICDSLQTMLTDGNVMEKLAKLKQQDKTLWQKIKDFIHDLAEKIREVYAKMTPYSQEAKIVAEMKDAIERLQDLFVEGLADASENYQGFRIAMDGVVEQNAEAVAEHEILTDGAVVTDGEGKRYSIRSMKADIADGKMFEDLKTICDWTQEQVDELRSNLTKLVEYMTPYRDILDMNETYGREGRRFSPYKPNSDPLYKISMDFSTLCSKRLLTQYVIEQLQLRENRPMTAEEQMAIRDMLNEYRKVEKGLQVACAMCYVEAARLKSPKQIAKWMADPETQMRNYFADKNPEFAAFIKRKQADFKESRGYGRDAKKKDMSAKDVRELNKIRPRLRSQYQVSAEEAAIIQRAKALPNSTYLTAANLASLSETEPAIYSAYTAFVRTATRSKSLETDEPYYYGDSTRDNGNGIVVTDDFIDAVNRENGMRFSSWSDWRIQHMLDYITAVIDNSVRGAAMHGYTKFGEEVRVLGKTGMMFNMSGVAGTQTGLNEDGSLSFSPTESIDVNEAIQLRDEFPDTAGLQCIGVGDDHIISLLRSDIIDYVIPYHTSGLNAVLRRMVNIHGWKDYTTTQHAAIDKSKKLEDSADKEHWHEEPVFSEFFVGYDTGMTGIEAMRASAELYKQMCAERGMKPKFEQFADEENYWKLLIDRKMINQKTGKLIRQRAVTPTFDFDTIREVVDRHVKNYDSNMEARALNHIVENWDTLPKRIRDLKKQGNAQVKKTRKAADTLANEMVAAQAAESTQDDRDLEAEVKYSIREDIVDVNGMEYDHVVELEYKVFNRVRRSGKAYIDFIRNNLIKQKITVFDDNGDLEVIEFAGEKERVLKTGAKNKHPVIGELTQAKNETKKLVIVNAIETAEISRVSGGSTEHDHQWLDENGWEERTSYVMTKDGTIYPVTLHIAKAKDGRNILYDVNVKINEGVAADKNATSLRAKKQAGQAVRTTMPSMRKVTQQNQKVKYSDRDYVAYDHTAILKESKVDEYLMDYAAKDSPKYAQAYIAYMRPSTFLKLTTSGWSERDHIYEQAGELNEERLRSSRPGIYLRLDHDAGKVIGHEGRHRMSAMDSAGIYYVPVLLLDDSNNIGKTDIAEMDLRGQFSEYEIGTVKDAIPLSFENRDRIIKKFATQSSMQRIGERYGYSKTLRFSDRDGESVSNRSLLANALESAAQTHWERRKLREYRENIDLINSEEKKLRELNRQIRAEKDSEKKRKLRDAATETANRINVYDGILLRLEATQPIQDVLSRERKAAYDRGVLREKKALEAYREKAEKRQQEIIDRYEKSRAAYRERAEKREREIIERHKESRKRDAENRHKAEMRQKIRKVIRELDKILNRGDKKRNVKEGMKDFVADALATAEILFTDSYSNEDMVRNGVGTELTPEESKYMAEAREILSEMANLPSGSYENWQARQEQEAKLKGRLDYRMGKLKDVFVRERARLNKMQVSEVLGKLADSYARLQNSEDAHIQGAYHENVHEYLTMLQEDIGGTIIRDMTLSQLEELYKAFTMVKTTVFNANRMFAENLNNTRDALANRVMAEVRKAGGEHGLWTKAGDRLNSFFWNNEKPVYAFERIGSETLKTLYGNIRKGQDSWAIDLQEANAFRLGLYKKYGYGKWDTSKQYNFTSASGADFSLNLSQIMSLYAYSRRKQAHDHLLKGGFVFDGNTEVVVNKHGLKMTYLSKNATAYNLTFELLDEIISKLTKDQKAFVEEMQEYLSTTVGEKGNEVSMVLYGVKLFKEKFYFPLRSAGQYMERAKEADLKKQNGQINLANSGFSKAVQIHASNPVVLTGFMDVWAGHVNEMSMYHSFVLPMEDFRRVYNYSSPHMEGQQSASVNGVIQNAYGAAATDYIDRLYRDLNGGAITDNTTGPINKLMGLFKKGAVFASASVVVQQPSAVARAMAMVDLKHFIGAKVDAKRHKALWEEVKKYAPVAVIKEMGFFDTNMGRNATEFLTAEEYTGIRQKAEALVKDEKYRDEILSKAPALADELTWCAIWEAVKRETKARHPGMNVKSEEFLKMAGDRFTEVIDKTQVYDSVLARSANMRSKDTGMKMATAFMAEPTTSINMVADAIRKGKKGNKKQAARIIGSVVASVILNSFLVSFVYAARDDDEEESYAEKYLSSFLSGIVDGINPATYIPFLKDIVSIVQGYDVERSDMSVISDLWSAWQKLGREDVSAWTKVEGFVGSICQIFGLPVKNIMRDVRSLYQVYNMMVNGEDTTSAGIRYAVREAVTGKSTSNMDQLYEARLDGDEEHSARVEARYDDEDSANAAVREAIKRRYMEGELDSSEVYEQLLLHAGATSTDINWMIDRWNWQRETGSDDGYSKYNQFYEAVKTGKNLKSVIKMYTDNDVERSTLSRQITEHFKPEYIKMSASERAGIKGYLLNAMVETGSRREDAEARMADWDFEAKYGFSYEERETAFMEGKISASELRKVYINRGKTTEEADNLIRAHEWIKDYGRDDLTADNVRHYVKVIDELGYSIEDTGMDVDMYFEAYSYINDIEGEEKAGKAVPYSRIKRAFPYIDSLDLTSKQKTALAVACGWSVKTVNKEKLW